MDERFGPVVASRRGVAVSHVTQRIQSVSQLSATRVMMMMKHRADDLWEKPLQIVEETKGWMAGRTGGWMKGAAVVVAGAVFLS